MTKLATADFPQNTWDGLAYQYDSLIIDQNPSFFWKDKATKEIQAVEQYLIDRQEFFNFFDELGPANSIVSISIDSSDLKYKELLASTGINIEHTNNSITIAANTTGILPDQSNNSGKFLITNGSSVSWSNSTDLDFSCGNITATGLAINCDPDYIVHIVDESSGSMALYADNIGTGHCFCALHTREGGGDPQVGFGIKNSEGESISHSWHMGIDNSDDDSFKLTQGNLGDPASTTISITRSGLIDFGTDEASSKLHIHSGYAGEFTPQGAYDDLVIEGDSSTGMTIVAPDDNLVGFSFATTSDDVRAYLQWDDATDLMSIGTSSSGASLRFVSGSNVEALRIDSSGNFDFQDGNLATTGSIKNNADSSKHYFGASDDAYIEFDGSNVNYATIEGGHVFTGEHITVPSITTTVRNALTPANGMVIYNSTNNRFEQYENGLWVYKSNVITEYTYVYVSTTGSDVTGDGTSGNPWATLDHALDYVANFILLAEFRILVLSGDYTSDTSALTINHPNGEFLSIYCIQYEETLTLDSVSGSAGDWDLTFLTSNTDYYDVGDHVLVWNAANGTDPELVSGVHEIKSKVASTSITLNSINGNATMASGSVTANITTPKCKFNRHFTLSCPLLMFRGFLLEYDTDINTSQAITLSSTKTSTYNIERCIVNNTGTSAKTGVGLMCSTGTYTIGSRLGFRNLLYGVYTYQVYTVNYMSSTGCQYGLVASSLGRANIYSSSFVSNTTGLYALNMAYIAAAYKIDFIDNGTDTSPVGGVIGNSNSIIVT